MDIVYGLCIIPDIIRYDMVSLSPIVSCRIVSGLQPNAVVTKALSASIAARNQYIDTSVGQLHHFSLSYHRDDIMISQHLGVQGQAPSTVTGKKIVTANFNKLLFITNRDVNEKGFQIQVQKYTTYLVQHYITREDKV